MTKRALIAMSGGVDSSVAAFLMKERGYDCVGATMKLFSNEDIGESREKTCCSLADVEDARSVAFALDIPFYVMNFSEEFRGKVIDRFVDAYERGETPNPCIDCNRYMKFDKLLHRAKELEISYVVTGHYARVERDTASGRYLLKKGLDTAKDQSYVLYMLTQEQLSHTLFPLGELTKEEVRRIAEERGFVNSRKRDSQDICFVKDGDYAAFIEQSTGRSYDKGDFVDKAGHVLGTHNGLIRYTTGQRKGLGLSLPEPLYVLCKDIEKNTVTLCRDEELYSAECVVEDFNWIAFPNPEAPFRASVKIRYKHTEQPAVVTPVGEDRVQIRFDTPQRAITSGQAAVLYDGDMVIGGGRIVQSS